MILTVDSTKINQVAPYKICNIEKVNVLVTDNGIDQEQARKFRSIGINVIIA